jgi:hypothetical protein
MRRRLLGIKNAGLGQHDQMRAVDGAEAVDMVVLAPSKSGRSTVSL